MLFFKKRLDYEKDRLYSDFDLGTEKYCFYKAGEKIDENLLNKKSLKKLRQLNQTLIDKPYIIENYRRLEKRSKRIDDIRKKGIDISCSLECLSIPEGTMSEEVANYLNNVTSDDNYLIGIHRTSLNGTQVADVLQNGLILTGDFEVVNSNPSIEQNVGFYPDNRNIIKEAVGAYNYKCSTGSIIIKIPLSEIGDGLYYKDSFGNKRVKPEYIDAY